MKALWAAGQATVHEIRDGLLPDRPLAYTTVMTVMDRLSRKGVVIREKKGRAHLYSPAVSEDAIRERALNHLIDNFFQGAQEELRKYLKMGGVATIKAATPDRRSTNKLKRATLHPPKRKETDVGMDASLL